MKQKKEEEYGSLIVACILKTRSVDNLKKTFIFMFVMILLTVFSGAANAESPFLNNTVKVYVDGSEIAFPDEKPFINPDNRTLVPVRFVSEALGAEVQWIDLTRTVIINYQGKTITLEIGLKQALVGTSIVTLDTNASIVNDRTMVPLRFVSECLGAEVQWVWETSSIYITTEDNVSDESLVNSDLELHTPEPGDNPNNVNLIAMVYYKYNTPVGPQLDDLQELLAKRFNGAEAPVMDYVKTKTGTDMRLKTKDFYINGKHVSVYDSIGAVSVTVWN